VHAAASGSALHSLLQPAATLPGFTPQAQAPPGTPLPQGLPFAAALQAQGLLGSRQFGMGASHRYSTFGGGGGGGGGVGGHNNHFGPGGGGGPGSARTAAAVQHGHVTYRDLHVIGERRR
jgi:hypothetical protein